MWTDYIKTVLGDYVPLLAPDGTPLQGIGSLNMPWVVNALLLIISVYMVLKIVNSIASRLGR